MLVENKVQTCGRQCKYAHGPRNDLTGQTFGCLYVEAPTTKTQYDNILWRCKCSCGNTYYATTASLNAGNVKSCGHVVSWGETTIQKILDRHKIKYKRQYTFKDLCSKKKYPYKFDFGILSQQGNLICLLEYQGIQHYKEFKNGFGKSQREESDPKKKEYCRKNNIQLFEIRYDEDIETAIGPILEYVQQHDKGELIA